jgi:hypothetical protein
MDSMVSGSCQWRSLVSPILIFLVGSTARDFLVTIVLLHCIPFVDQWRNSPDRALAYLYGFHDSFIVRCGVVSSTIDLF